MLEFLVGTSELSVRMGDWLDSHPMAALAIVTALIVLGVVIEGVM